MPRVYECDLPQNAPRVHAESLDSLNRIKVLSDTARVSTDRMQERWAKDFRAGEFEARQKEIMSIPDTKEREKAVNWEGGASYVVCIALYSGK